MIARLLRGLGVALVLTLALEFVHGLHGTVDEAFTRLLELSSGVIALDVLVVWALLLFLHALTNRFWVSAGIVTVLAAVVGIADVLKMSFRNEPLFLSDAAYLSEIGFLIDNVGAGVVIGALGGVVAVPLAIWALARTRAVRRLRARLAAWVGRLTHRPEHARTVLHEAHAGERRATSAMRRARRERGTSAMRRARRERATSAMQRAVRGRATSTRAPRRSESYSRISARAPALRRMAMGVASLTVLFAAASFNWPGSPARALYEAAGATWRPWNQSQNYDDNGLIAGLLYTLPASPMDEPEGYGEDAMAGVVERYTARAAELNAGRDAHALDGVNVVTILSESLSDPLALPALTAAEDPMPFLRELMATNPSGTLISSGYGGGTANVEFEVLTGMATSNFRAQVDSPFQSIVAPSDGFPSYLRWLAADREALALHPYSSRFYRRNAVYPALGFDQALFRDAGLEHLRKLPGDRYVSDASLFGELVDHLRDEDQPMFVNVATMQNHGPQQGLADPIPVDGPLSDAQAESGAQYLAGIRHSDDALRGLVEDLAELGEPTVVLLYGDHLPSFWPSEVLNSGSETARYETPWVVFANFPLTDAGGADGPDAVGVGGAGAAGVDGAAPAEAPAIGANQLMNQIVDAMGAHHTPWTALLHDLAAELPAMERTAWLDAAGNVTGEDELSERGRELLRDYRLAQYDMAVGDGWGTGPMLGVTGGE